MGAISLKTEVPGPRSRDLLARRAAAAPSGLGKATDVVVERADGALVHDVDGNTFLDFVGGIGMLAVGHSPPNVVKAISDQAAKYVHLCALVGTMEPYVRLCELLNEVTPGTFTKKSLLANSGAEGVENAVSAARRYTGRPAVICFEGGYHGRTLLTLSLTSKYSLFKKGMGPFASDIYRLPMPNVYRRPAGTSADQAIDFGLQQLEQVGAKAALAPRPRVKDQLHAAPRQPAPGQVRTRRRLAAQQPLRLQFPKFCDYEIEPDDWPGEARAESVPQFVGQAPAQSHRAPGTSRRRTQGHGGLKATDGRRQIPAAGRMGRRSAPGGRLPACCRRAAHGTSARRFPLGRFASQSSPIPERRPSCSSRLVVRSFIRRPNSISPNRRWPWSSRITLP